MAKPINWKSNLFFVWVAEICSRAGFSIAIPFIPFFMRDRYLLGEGAVKNGVMLFGLAGSVALFSRSRCGAWSETGWDGG